MGFLARRLRLYLSLVAFLVPFGAIAAELEPKTIRDFKAGLVTDQDSTLIPDGAAQDLSNVDVDDGSIRKRRGTTLKNATPIGADQSVRFLHEYVDSTNSFWLLAVSSNSLYGSTDGGATFSLLTSTYGITSTSRFQAANAYSTCYLVDGSTNAIEYNGSAVSANTSIPAGGVIAFYAGRLWVASGSTLYGSRVDSDTDWTDDGVDDADAFSAVIRNTDGFTITTLRPFGQDLLVFKAKSIDRLSVNSDGLNFSLYPVTSHLGTTHPDSVVAVDNAVVWLAEDGYYAYDGSQIKRISEAITPTVNEIRQLDALTRSYSETDMTAGTDDNTTAERTAGQVMLDRQSFIDTAGSDFGAGTLVNMSTTIYDGALAHNDGNANLTNNSFETPVTFWSTVNTKASTNACNYDDPSIPAVDGSTAAYCKNAITVDRNVVVEVWNAALTTLLGTPLDVAPTSTYSDYSWSMAPYGSQSVRVRFRPKTQSISSERLTSGAFTSTFSTMTVSLRSINVATYTITAIDYVRGGVGSVWTSTFTSAAKDSGVVSPAWTAGSANYTANGSSITFATSSSPDGIVWESSAAWTPGTAPSSSAQRYLRYYVYMATTPTTSGVSFVSDVTLNVGASSGRYLSPAIDLSGWSSWLPFTANGSSDGGGLTYELYIDSNTAITPTVASTFISSQTITSGGTPTVSTNTYAFIAATMTTTGTPDPYVEDWLLQWGEGSISNIVSSAFYDQAYYSAVTIDGSSNNTVLIYDSNGSWTKYDGLEPYFLRKYRTNLLFGAVGAGDVVQMQVDNRYRDYDDAAISCYWISKDFDMGYPITTKSLISYYITGGYFLNGSLTFEYGVERGTLTGTSHLLDANTGFFRKVVKPTSLTYSEGIQHRFKVSDNTIDVGMSVLSITGRWRLNTNP